MDSVTSTSRPAATSGDEWRKRGRLALAFQEVLTVAARLQSGRYPEVDSGTLRSHVKQLLRRADDEARSSGYGSEHVKLATYTVIAFVDESVLGSGRAVLADWARQPLQEEIFDDHMAGERVFENLKALMAQPDSEHLADVLEVHQLCLLLGFRGRYGRGDEDRVRTFIEALDDRIGRIRGRHPLGPEAFPGAETVPPRKDPWLRRLAILATVVVVGTVVLFVTYSLLLSRLLSAVEPLASGG